jgi:adenylate kinase
MITSSQLLDVIEDDVKKGGYIIDWHACEMFPKSWIDLVIVLRTNSSHLYDRLKARNYAENKLQENLDAEIMEVILAEARESYDEEIVIELESNEDGDIESNVERIETWIKTWKESHAN